MLRVIENLAGVVEHTTGRRLADDVLQRKTLKLCPCNQFVQVVHIGLQVLAMMESQRLVTDDRRQGLVREVD